MFNNINRLIRATGRASIKFRRERVMQNIFSDDKSAVKHENEGFPLHNWLNKNALTISKLLLFR